MSEPVYSFKEQLEKILKIDNEEVNPFGKPFNELDATEKDIVRAKLECLPSQIVHREKAAARSRRIKDKMSSGKATIVLLGKFNQKTEKLMTAKAKELGYNFPSSLINDAIEDLLGIPRGSSLPDGWEINR